TPFIPTSVFLSGLCAFARDLFQSSRLDRLDGRNPDALEVFLDALGFAVEVMDADFLAGELSAPLEPLQEFLGRVGLEQANGGFEGRGLPERRMRDRHELSETLAASEDDRPGLNELPVQGEGVVEPPGFDYAF